MQGTKTATRGSSAGNERTLLVRLGFASEGALVYARLPPFLKKDEAVHKVEEESVWVSLGGCKASWIALDVEGDGGRAIDWNGVDGIGAMDLGNDGRGKSGGSVTGQ